MARGDVLLDGTFFRNASSKVVPLRYPNVGNQLGRRVKWARVKWTRMGVPELSVNWQECVRCAYCSIQLDMYPDKFSYVVRLHLKEFAALLGVRILAAYDPVTDTEANGEPYDNPCHFNLVPEEPWDDFEARLDMLNAPTNVRQGGWPPPSPQEGQPGWDEAQRLKAREDAAYVVLEPKANELEAIQ